MITLVQSLKETIDQLYKTYEDYGIELTGKWNPYFGDLFNESNKELSSNYESLFIKISDLFNKISSNNLWDALSKSHLEKISILVNFLSQRYVYTAHTGLYNENWLTHSLPSEVNRTLAHQELKVKLQPLSKDFTKESIDFKAQKNSEMFKEGMILNNYHIAELDITEKQYGLDGSVTFELCYPDNHPDFDFLFDESLLVYLDIELTDTFRIFTKENKLHTKESKFVAIGKVESISKPLINGHYSKASPKATIKRFHVTFCDPLKAIWSLHKPNYIDCLKNLDDIFNDNHINDFGTKEIFDVDYQDCKKLKADKLKQVFVSTKNRSFYDFFIEQLALNECVIKYDSNPKGSDSDITYPLYYIADDIKALEGNKRFSKIKEYKLKKCSEKYTEGDLFSVENQMVLTSNLSGYIKQNPQSYNIRSINKDDDFQEKHKNDIESAQEDNVEVFNFLYENATAPTAPKSYVKTIEVEAVNSLPFLHTELDFTVVKNSKEDEEITIDSKDGQITQKGADLLLKNEEFYLKTRHLKIERSKLSTTLLYKSIPHTIYDNADKEEDRFEKIAFLNMFNDYNLGENKFFYLRKARYLNKVTYSLGVNTKETIDPRIEYPYFKPYQSFNITGKVIVDATQIGKVIKDKVQLGKKDDQQKKDDVNNRQYKFFSDFELDESSIKDAVKDKKSLFYAVEVPCSLFRNIDEKNPVIYIPVNLYLNSKTNEFSPLRNGDLVVVKVAAINKCLGYKVISSSATCVEKATELHTQGYLFGSNEDCAVSYIEAAENEEKKYLIKQENKENNNALSLMNNREGISLTYIAKEQK